MTALHWFPALSAPELLGAPVRDALTSWAARGEAEAALAHRVEVAAIDPELADTAAMTEAYGLPLEQSVNCVVVAG